MLLISVIVAYGFNPPIDALLPNSGMAIVYAVPLTKDVPVALIASDSVS